MRRLWLIALSLVLAAIPGRAQQATQPTDAPVPANQLAAKKINPPILVHKGDPQFSDEAKAKQISGICLVLLVVDTQGHPQNTQIVRCSDPSFEKSSLDTVKQYLFKPATTQEGKPVPVRMSVVVSYQLWSGMIATSLVHSALYTPVRFGFNSPPGIKSPDPGADGVYPLTKFVTAPVMTKFFDDGYGISVFSDDGSSSCDIVLTIDVKGKAFDPQVTHCDRPALETPAVQSLLKSKYKPGKVNGKAVPMRATIHLEYGGLPPKL
jgi:TonB family protein